MWRCSLTAHSLLGHQRAFVNPPYTQSEPFRVSPSLVNLGLPKPMSTGVYTSFHEERPDNFGLQLIKGTLLHYSTMTLIRLGC